MNVKQFMIDVNPQLKNKYLNVNHPNAPIKKTKKIFKVDKKQEQTLCCLKGTPYI